MLYRNGENLKEGLIEHLSNKINITIFCPYIKVTTLKTLLDTPGMTCEQIIVRWDPKDLAMGSSDLEIYNICKERNITLYMNSRIHLKLYTNNFDDALLGSANISERAISENANNFNYEVCTYVESISRNDRLYLYRIINESILVTDEIYKAIKEQIPDITPDLKNKSFELKEFFKNSSDFLISKLPMLDSPELLWKLYSGEIEVESQEQENCFCHDLSLYEVNTLGRGKKEFFDDLTNNFFELPFIISFLEEVDNSSRTTKRGEERNGLQFGAVRKWFSNNTTSVPSPRPFELTNNVQILYSWIEYLSDGEYSISIPGSHSQVISRNSSKKI